MLDVTAFKILEKRFHFPVFNGTEGIECISSGRITTAERAVWIQVSLNNFPGLLNFRFLGGLFVYLKIRREHIWCVPLCIPFFDPVLSRCIIFLPKLGKFPLFQVKISSTWKKNYWQYFDLQCLRINLILRANCTDSMFDKGKYAEKGLSRLFEVVLIYTLSCFWPSIPDKDWLKHNCSTPC